MEIFEIRCPNCKSKLSCKNGFTEYVCPFCDSQFIVTGNEEGIAATLESKRLDNKRYFAELSHARKLQRIENERHKEDLKFKKFMEPNIRLVFFIVLGIIAAIFGWVHLDDESNRNIEKYGYDPKNLASISSKAQEYLQAGELDKAEIVISQIYYTYNDSKTEKQWNATRKALEKQLKEAREEAEKEAKRAQKEAEKESDDSSFWSFLPWVA